MTQETFMCENCDSEATTKLRKIDEDQFWLCDICYQELLERREPED